MPSGLIQLVAYGNQDVFLTRNPEITFFKHVYKRFSNFAIESIEEFPLTNLNFGDSATFTLSKIGDLIYKIYVKIDIPAVWLPTEDLVNLAIVNNINNQINSIKIIQQKFAIYIKNSMIYLNQLELESKAIGRDYTSCYNITIAFKNSNFYDNIISAGTFYYNDILLVDPVNYFLSNLATNSQYTNNTDNARNLFFVALNSFIQNYVKLFTSIDKQYQDQIYNLNLQYKSNTIKNDPFGWTTNLGYKIIKNISVDIGGRRVTSFDSDLLNIYYSLYNNYYHNDTLSKMIGNISNNQIYDSNPKQAFSMYIPIPFWFSIFNGSAIPCIALKYHDININIQLEDLTKCCHYYKHLNLSNYISLTNVSLYIDYVYLDDNERVKFAQLGHEYIIQETQNIIYDKLSTEMISLELNFFHPVKELYWIITNDMQDTYNLNQLYFPMELYKLTMIKHIPGTYNQLSITLPTTNFNFKVGEKIQLYFTIAVDGIYTIVNIVNNIIILYSNKKISIVLPTYYGFYGLISNVSNSPIDYSNPINTASITLNNKIIQERTYSKFFNYVIPHKYYNNMPLDGLNVYSFSLFPFKYQPSGSCNFTEIDFKNINISISKRYYNYISKTNQNYRVKLYAINYNILRIMQGIGSIVYSGSF